MIADAHPTGSSAGVFVSRPTLLVEFEGVTQVEAAERLGLSVSGMKRRVQRARLHLRTALDECSSETLGSESSPSATPANPR